MKLKNNYFIKIITVGLITLTAYLILLGLAQRTLKIITYETILRYARLNEALTFTPSQLTPDLDSEPNLATPSRLRAEIGEGAFLAGFAAIDFLFNNQWPNVHRTYKKVSSYNEHTKETEIRNELSSLIYYDNSLKLFVYTSLTQQNNSAYAGPNGIAKSPDKKLGTFQNPLSYCRNLTPQLFVFNTNHSRFFRFNFDSMEFTQGPKLPPNQSCVRVGDFHDRHSIYISWRSPTTEKYVDQSSNFYPTIRRSPSSRLPDKVLHEVNMEHNLQIVDCNFDNADFIPILQQNTRVSKLDPVSLTITDQLGFLEEKSSTSMDDILAYDLNFFFRDGQYLGMAAAHLNRNARKAMLILFNKDGSVMKIPPEKTARDIFKTDKKLFINRTGYARVNIFSIIDDQPGGPLILTIQYLLDNLHPPLLSLASCIRPNHFDAHTSECTILFTPNSLAANFNRYENINRFEEVFAIFLFHGLALTFGAFLAWRIVRDARQLGLSRQSRKFWIIAAVTLGLPAYITYRLTRPAITRVTCPNCGRLRRPDQPNCANCNAPWLLPDLIPPTWKVTIH
ncbi:MAG: zinc ribbon domain-containing protein [Sedimentisphaerales bacterium]|nr:zinc ribbon domain-containing protein [Sedimentisphaerales bacterium]